MLSIFDNFELYEPCRQTSHAFFQLDYYSNASSASPFWEHMQANATASTASLATLQMTNEPAPLNITTDVYHGDCLEHIDSFTSDKSPTSPTLLMNTKDSTALHEGSDQNVVSNDVTKSKMFKPVPSSSFGDAISFLITDTCRIAAKVLVDDQHPFKNDIDKLFKAYQLSKTIETKPVFRKTFSSISDVPTKNQTALPVSKIVDGLHIVELDTHKIRYMEINNKIMLMSYDLLSFFNENNISRASRMLGKELTASVYIAKSNKCVYLLPLEGFLCWFYKFQSKMFCKYKIPLNNIDVRSKFEQIVILYLIL